MYSRCSKWIFLGLVMAAAAQLTLTVPMAHAQKTEQDGAKSQVKRLSANRYFVLRPFVLPLLIKGEIEEQFTIVIALEMEDSDSRGEIRRVIPRVRNNLYKTLYGLVTFRRRGSPIPDIDVFKNRLLEITQAVTGTELVKDLLVQQAFRKVIR
jgi:hypothetical protein